MAEDRQGAKLDPASASALQPDFDSLGRLIAEIAHEARNPLASILAGLEAWEQEPELGFDPFGPRIQREAMRLSTLMDGLLELARPARESRRRVSVGMLLEEVVASAALGLEGKDVTLETIQGPGDVLVEGDPIALCRLLRNLVDNAIQHSPGGSVVRVSLDQQDGSVLLRIVDSGPGLTEDELDRVFEPFFSRRRGGAGLGLAIVDKIASEHGGEVALRNRASGGAEAEVRLPLLEPVE